MNAGVDRLRPGQYLGRRAPRHLAQLLHDSDLDRGVHRSRRHERVDRPGRSQGPRRQI